MTPRTPVFILLSAILFTAAGATHATTPPEQATGIWGFALLQGQLSPRWRVSLESHLRTSLTPSPATLQALQITPAVGFELLSGLYVWAAYSRFEGIPELSRDENRLWQQIVYDLHSEQMRILLRARVEERFFTGEASIAGRLRLLVRGGLTLDTQKNWHLIGQNEIFFHLNALPSGMPAGLDQNRIQVALQRQLTAWWTLDLGYQLQYQLQANQPDRMSHNLVLIQTFKFSGIKDAVADPSTDAGTQE